MSAPGADLEGDQEATLAEENVVDEDDFGTSSESEDEGEAEEEMDYWAISGSEEEDTHPFNVDGVYLDLIEAQGIPGGSPRRFLSAGNRVKALGCIIVLCVVGVSLLTLYVGEGNFKLANPERPPTHEVLYKVILVFLACLSIRVFAIPKTLLSTGSWTRRCWDELRCFLLHLVYLHCVASFLFAYFDVQPDSTKQDCTASRDCQQPHTHLESWKFAAAFVSVLVTYGLRHLLRKLRSLRSGAAHPEDDPLPQQDVIAPDIASHQRFLECTRG